MDNIVSDFVEEIEFKPNRFKFIIKWVVRISTVLIGGAFLFGQLKMSHLNKLDEMEKSINAQNKAITELHEQMLNEFGNVNSRINKMYVDGYNEFDDYQTYNKKQLELIIDYGQTNKELLKKMLELNAIEKNGDIQNEILKQKNDEVKPELKINVKKVE